MTTRAISAIGFVVALLIAPLGAKEPEKNDLYDRSRVGPLEDGRVIVPTNQILSPAGRQVIVGGRPTDVALSPDGRWLAVQNFRDVMVVDVKSGEIASHADIKGASFKGIVFAPDGKRIYVSTMR